MTHLTAHELTIMFLSLAVLMGLARLLGEFARRWHQPAVLGEMLAGVLLGPTCLGALRPDWYIQLFPPSGANAVVLHGISNLAIVLFLLVAGMEVDLSLVWRQGRAALKVGLLGTLIPFLAGLACAVLWPQAFDQPEGANPRAFALFLATAIAISALPVIAKTLMDLNLYRTDLGMVVVSAAVFNDLIGWTVFALVLGLLQSRPSTSAVGMALAWTMLFMVTVLTLGRWLIHRALLFLQAYTHWPGGVLGFAFTIALLGAACTEALGVHAIFGSFLVGVALGASPRMQERTRAMMDEFVSFVFAPLFFAMIGLRVDFLAHFDGRLVLLVLGVACASKFAGAVWGARWGGFAARDAWAIGWAMNARGAMEIILGLLALEAGVIRQPLFVALVVMALITSALSGPAMRWILRRQQTRLLSLLSSRTFVRNLNAETPREAIRELVGFICRGSTLDAEHVESLVWAREEMAATGIGHGVALPHARLDGLESPLVAVGLSDAGIPFDAPDGQPAHVLFLMLTPGSEPTLQLDLSASIAALFGDSRSLGKVLRASNFTEFLATMRALDAQLERS